MIKNRKSENFEKNQEISTGPNHGANERPKGEPVAVGDLKVSLIKV